MSVRIDYDVRRLTQDEFAAVAYRVMGQLFDIHRDFGRLFDEEIYQRELLQRLPEARAEVPVQVTFDSFCKTYYLDLLIQGAIFEFKTVEAIVPRHRAQLLNYLLLADTRHGKLVNLRRERVQHEFVNTTLTRADRIAFSIDDSKWNSAASRELKSWSIDLFRDLGAGLDLSLYREAVLHHCNPDSCVAKVEVYGANGLVLGAQEQTLLNPETALHISAIDPNDCVYLESQLGRFLAHSALRTIQWINITRSLVTFTTLCR
jgi:GxxExxY protein